ncbi:MAG: galactose oxidase [Chthoniobacteraceae bacterium]
MPLVNCPVTIELFGCLAIGGFARFALWAGCLLGAVYCAANASAGEHLVWEKLPPIPDEEGFAGAFAGVSNGALIVAGGANITGEKWGETFRKQWHDSVFVLGKPDGEWRSGFRLPRPLGYGVSVTTERGVVCIGGSDSQRHYADVFLLEWRDGRIVTTAMLALPKPCANSCGVLVGKVIYVAGGIEKPDATVAMKTFWKLDLAAAEPRWESLEPWPGPERMLAVAGAIGESFFIFSGARLSTGAEGKPVREFLRDAYRFTPGKGWKRIADMPRAAVAAPSPALHGGGTRLLIVSGDDGTNVAFAPVREHPGFPRDVLAYDPERDVWSAAGEAPFSRATVPAVLWRGHYVIPNGEVRPRVRTPEVWSAQWKTAP